MSNQNEALTGLGQWHDWSADDRRTSSLVCLETVEPSTHKTQLVCGKAAGRRAKTEKMGATPRSLKLHPAPCTPAASCNELQVLEIVVSLSTTATVWVTLAQSATRREQFWWGEHFPRAPKHDGHARACDEAAQALVRGEGGGKDSAC